MIADPVLVVVDMQRYFCLPEFDYLPEDRADDVTEIVDRTAAFLDRYRGAGYTPIFVRTHHDSRTNSAVWDRKYGESPTPCLPGTEGAEFHPDLGVTADDLVVTKHRYDSFHETNLPTYLSANGVTELLLAGVATHVCVESAARSGFDRDYDVTVLADCTASADPDDRRSALARIDGLFGTVQESDDIELAN